MIWKILSILALSGYVICMPLGIVMGGGFLFLEIVITFCEIGLFIIFYEIVKTAFNK